MVKGRTKKEALGHMLARSRTKSQKAVNGSENYVCPSDLHWINININKLIYINLDFNSEKLNCIKFKKE